MSSAMPFFSSSRRSTRSISRRRRSSVVSAIQNAPGMRESVAVAIASAAGAVKAAIHNRMRSMHALVARDARFHPHNLLGRRLVLMLRLPFGHRHAVDDLARGVLVAFEAGVANPVGEAIAAEPGEPHQ